MVPDSEIWLCRNTKLTPDSEDTYYFATESARSNFFIGKSSEYAPQLHFTETSYIRTDKYIQLPVSYIDAAYCDYCVFRNTLYSNKLFYAFITSVEYINDKTTRIYFEIDPVQTWLPSLALTNAQYINRETVLSDSYGANVLDEGLSAGQLKVYRTDSVSAGAYTQHANEAKATIVAVKRLAALPGAVSNINLHYTTACVMSKAANFWGDSAGLEGVVYEAPLLPKQGSYCSLFYVAFLNNSSTPGKIAKFLRLYTGEVNWTDPLSGASAPKLTSDDVVGIFSCPPNACPLPLRTAWGNDGTTVGIIGGNGFVSSEFTNSGAYFCQFDKSAPGDVVVNITPNTSYTSGMFGGYQPKNKKCFQSPFVEISVDNMLGSSETFHPELFNSGEVRLCNMINNTSAQAFMRVTNYNGEDPYMHVISTEGFPSYCWNSNSFSEWYGLHGTGLEHNQNVAMFGQISQLGASLAAGSVSGTVNSLVGIADQEFRYKQSMYQAQAMSPKSHGNSGGNYFLRSKDRDYSVINYMCAHDDAVRAADIYFTKFGYRVDKVGSINFTGRSRFNYVKLSGDLQGSGNIPVSARTALNRAFNRGLRFWHGDYLGDYSVNNAIS